LSLHPAKGIISEHNAVLPDENIVCPLITRSHCRCAALGIERKYFWRWQVRRQACLPLPPKDWSGKPDRRKAGAPSLVNIMGKFYIECRDNLARKITKTEILAGRWTYNDYKNWDLKEGERYELIDGIAYPMGEPREGMAYGMAGPSLNHQLVSGELFRQIANYLVGKRCKVLSAPLDVRLHYEQDGKDSIVVQPDIVVVCDENKRAKDGIHGVPDFIIEILSPSTSSEDMLRKFNLYMRAKVQEYWLVDPENKHLMTCILQDDGYYDVVKYEADKDVPVGIFPDFSVKLTDVF
jgi:Uma2 family endonuclease